MGQGNARARVVVHSYLGQAEKEMAKGVRQAVRMAGKAEAFPDGDRAHAAREYRGSKMQVGTTGERIPGQVGVALQV